MTITYTIPGATLIDQLHESTSDGHVDENASDNCVAVSVAEGLHIETGQTFNGDELKDAVYGQGWTGFQAARSYIGYCASHGVSLTPHDGSQADLVATIHAQVRAGHPVIVTMPSEWGTAPADPVHPSGTTHVGIAVGDGPGEIRVMNPWHGFFQDQSDAWWAARLCEGQVWVMTRKAGVATMGTPTGWTDDGKVLTAPGGAASVGTGFREYILTHPWEADDVPLGPETDVAEVEIANTQHGAGTVQYFRYSALIWSRSENVVLRSWVGREAMVMRARLAALQAKLTPLQASLQSAQKTLASAQSNLSTMQAQRDAAQAQVSALQTQLATANAALAKAQAPAAPAAPAAPSTPADAAALLVRLIYAQAEATLKATTQPPAAS